MVHSCLSCNSRSPAPAVGGQAGTRGGKVAPPKYVSETENNPQENNGKDYAEGEGKTAPWHRCSLRLTFQGAGLTLLLYDLSSVAFWTSPLPPGHEGSVTALAVSGCWLCLTMGGRMKKQGDVFQPLPAWDKTPPRQEFTSSMQLDPSLVLGLGCKPCKAPGGMAEGVQGDEAAPEHGAPLSPPDWLSQPHPPVPP